MSMDCGGGGGEMMYSYLMTHPQKPYGSREYAVGDAPLVPTSPNYSMLSVCQQESIRALGDEAPHYYAKWRSDTFYSFMPLLLKKYEQYQVEGLQKYVQRVELAMSVLRFERVVNSNQLQGIESMCRALMAQSSQPRMCTSQSQQLSTGNIAPDRQLMGMQPEEQLAPQTQQLGGWWLQQQQQQQQVAQRDVVKQQRMHQHMKVHPTPQFPSAQLQQQQPQPLVSAPGAFPSVSVSNPRQPEYRQQVYQQQQQQPTGQPAIGSFEPYGFSGENLCLKRTLQKQAAPMSSRVMDGSSAGQPQGLQEAGMETYPRQLPANQKAGGTQPLPLSSTGRTITENAAAVTMGDVYSMDDLVFPIQNEEMEADSVGDNALMGNMDVVMNAQYQTTIVSTTQLSGVVRCELAAVENRFSYDPKVEMTHDGRTFIVRCMLRREQHVPALRLVIPRSYPSSEASVERAILDLDSFYYDDLQTVVHDQLNKLTLRSITDILDTWDKTVHQFYAKQAPSNTGGNNFDDYAGFGASPGTAGP